MHAGTEQLDIIIVERFPTRTLLSDETLDACVCVRIVANSSHTRIPTIAHSNDTELNNAS